MAGEKFGDLRFITCGSVDDGKSTLIGRMLYDSDLLSDDQRDNIEQMKGSKDVDFASIVDGLSAEQEQGITIDVAYRYFATKKRKFTVLDTPGHEQYTRNMATGASVADLAIVIVDARKGVLQQTRRHSFITSLMGIKYVILAVNKMDLVNYSQEVFEQIKDDFKSLVSDFKFDNVSCVPVSALMGDNVVRPSENMEWYDDKSVLSLLEVSIINEENLKVPFRMPVQWVNRPNQDFRGFCGTISSGKIKKRQMVKILPGLQTSHVKSIETYDGPIDSAVAGQAITLTLADEIDVSRGDVICEADNLAEITDQFQAHLIWMDKQPLLPGRQYLIKMNNKTVNGEITELKYKVNINTLDKEASKTLDLNDIGVCNFSLNEAMVYEPFEKSKFLGSFIMIDKLTNTTVAGGMIDFGLRRATNTHWQKVDVNQKMRAEQKGQKPCIVWFTGLSASGKSTIANLVEKKLLNIGKHTYLLDGDNVRHGLNKDLGFVDVDRVENVRRIGEVSKLMVDAGLIVLTAFISPFRSERQMVRDLVENGEFLEVFVDTPLEICEQRDPKGLYKKVRAGQIKNFTGFDSPYEAPRNPDIHIQADKLTPEDAADLVIQEILKIRS